MGMRLAKYLTATPALLAVLMLVALAAGQVVGASALPAPSQGSAEQAQAIRPPAEGSAAALLADCEKPAEGELPGSVVVTREGAVAPIVGGEALVGQALDQAFGGVDHGLTIHGFCG